MYVQYSYVTYYRSNIKKSNLCSSMSFPSRALHELSWKLVVVAAVDLCDLLIDLDKATIFDC